MLPSERKNRQKSKKDKSRWQEEVCRALIGPLAEKAHVRAGRCFGGRRIRKAGSLAAGAYRVAFGGHRVMLHGRPKSCPASDEDCDQGKDKCQPHNKASIAKG